MGKNSYGEDGCNASNIGIRDREHCLKTSEQISALQNYMNQSTTWVFELIYLGAIFCTIL
jgi:hypothetical protein